MISDVFKIVPEMILLCSCHSNEQKSPAISPPVDVNDYTVEQKNIPAVFDFRK